MTNLRGLITDCGKDIGLSCAMNFLENMNNAYILGISRTETEHVKKFSKKFLETFKFREADLGDCQER